MRQKPLSFWAHSICASCRRSAQDQASQHQSTMGEEASWAPTPNWRIMDIWWLMGKGELVFFKSVAPDRWMALFPEICEQHSLDLISSGTKLWGWIGWVGGVMGRSGSKYNQNICVEFSKKFCFERGKWDPMLCFL